jgi:hypothetical protein
LEQANGRSCQVHPAGSVRRRRAVPPRHQPRQWIDFMLHVRRLGGEGAMFRNPEITDYEVGRSENLLRFKFAV